MNGRADERAWWGKGPALFSRLHEGGRDGTTAAVAEVNFEASESAEGCGDVHSRWCLEMVAVGGSMTPLTDLAAGSTARSDTAPAEPSAEMGGSAGIGSMPAAAGRAGSGKRCDVRHGAAAGRAGGGYGRGSRDWLPAAAAQAGGEKRCEVRRSAAIG